MFTRHLNVREFKTITRLFFVTLLSSIIMGGILTGCSKDDGGSEPPIKDKEDQITFPSTGTPTPTFSTEGGSEKISFTATSDWAISVATTRAESWCTVSPTSGKAGNATITVTTTANDTPDDREATITLVCGTKKTSFKVSQKQKNALTTTTSKFEVSDMGGEIEIEIKANITFECTVDAAAASWITPVENKASTRALVSTKKRFAVAENTEAKVREGKIIVKSGDLKEEITVTQSAAKPVEIKNSQEVDLGLSVVWAAWNVGATKPEEVGNFYAWGETKTKNSYYDNTYGLKGLYQDGKETRLDAQHDAATVNWGNKWRTPTAAEIMELKRSEKMKIGTYTHNGVKGWILTSANGNSMFFPNTGWRDYSSHVQNPDHLGFWSSTPDPDHSDKAYSFYSDPSGTIFDGLGTILQTTSLRCNGLTVRAVRRPDVQFSDFKAENITETTADISFAVSLDGTAADNITSVGFQVSATNEMTYTSAKETHTVQIQNGRISIKLDKLAATTTYFIRPFLQSKKDGSYYGSVQQFTTGGSLSTEQWIDMGLSVKWASRNIGATVPTESGNWFGWAEVTPRTNNSYVEIARSKYYSHKEEINIIHSPNSTLSQQDVIHHFSKYAEDGKLVLEAEDDAASVIWKEGARMATKKEWEELIENCEWKEAIISGVKGWRVTSKKNKNVIFLPSDDAYWTSSLKVEEVKSYKKNSEEVLKTYYRYSKAYYMHKDGTILGGGRSYGFHVRPVHE